MDFVNVFCQENLSSCTDYDPVVRRTGVLACCPVVLHHAPERHIRECRTAMVRHALRAFDGSVRLSAFSFPTPGTAFLWGVTCMASLLHIGNANNEA